MSNTEEVKETTWEEQFEKETAAFKNLDVPVEEQAASADDQSGAKKEDDNESPGQESATDDKTNESEDQKEAEVNAESDDKQEKEETNPADDTSANAEPAEKPKNKVPKSVQRRIDREVKKRRELERELEELKRKQAQPKVSDSEGEKQEDQAAGPQPEAFDTWDDYQQAQEVWEQSREKHDAKTSAKSAKAEEPETSPEPEIALEVQEAAELVRDSIEDVKENVSDYDEVLQKAVDDGLLITDDMTIALSETDNPGQVLYELAKNPKESQRIGKMSKTRQTREIFRLEEKMSREAEKPAPKPKKKTTNAPDPVKPLGGTSTGTKTYMDPDISFAEFERMRNEEDLKDW